jgi:2-polyprenyl-3-methyl-5-hydroxy-6-metoxy-1,4-benzoquinol methylase
VNDASAAQFYDRYWDFRTERGDTTARNRIKLRHEQAVAFIRRSLPDPASARLVDLGCGDGIIGQMLTPLGYHVTGADVSERALQIASPHYAATQLLDLDRSETPGAWGGAFDGVVCLEVLEHIEQPRENIRRIAELLKPGGVAAFSYPNIFSWRNRWLFMTGRWPHGYCTYDPREHLQVFELPVFRQWVIEAGFEVVDLAITPDLPRWKPLRRAMFSMRGLLGRVAPVLSAMQIALFARKN